ncbi:MAG: zinc-dependent alcohol dehydrogenase family protein [Acidobacteriaceae bacterium]
MSAASATTARFVRFHQTGEPEVLQLESLPIPEPAVGEVRIRVKAIGLNRAESMFRKGQYLYNPKLPSLLGYEASGIVEAVGPGGDTSLVGKTVSTVPAFHADQYGVYGEVAIVPQHAVAGYPASFSYEQGTSIWMQYLTAYGALVHIGKVTAGDFVLITAASSSVGLAAIETTRAEGGTSIAVTRTAKKKAELLALGADHVIVSAEEDLAARVAEITGGKGARIIFDPIAGSGIEALATVAAQGGIIIEYGMLSGEPTPFPFFPAMTKGLSVRAYTLFEINSDPALSGPARQYVLRNLQSGAFVPRIAKTFTLDQIVEAHRYMESNAQIGKIVVTV